MTTSCFEESDGVSRCPFQPNSPVDPQFFVGRSRLLNRIGSLANEAVTGCVRTVYLCGPVRIGKTSLAQFTTVALEQDQDMVGFHVFLRGRSGPKTLEEMLRLITVRIIQSKWNEPSVFRKIKSIFSKLIIEVDVGMVKLKNKELQDITPTNADEFIDFLLDLSSKLNRNKSIRPGFIFVFDEIELNESTPFFADFIKAISDSASTRARKISLLILVCGTPLRFQQLMKHNVRFGDMLTLLDVDRLEEEEVEMFFTKAFRDAGQSLTNDALEKLVAFSDGFPQLMHHVGQATYTFAYGNATIRKREACAGISIAAGEWGRKYVNPKVIDLFEDPHFSPIIRALCQLPTDRHFLRRDLIRKLHKKHHSKVGNFLQKLKKLRVIERGANQGEWHFVELIESLYIHMLSVQEQCEL